jgi:hypothetical protein
LIENRCLCEEGYTLGDCSVSLEEKERLIEVKSDLYLLLSDLKKIENQKENLKF